jgi:nitric oxide reductase NorE protein
MLGAAIACGLAFVVTKVVEYVEKFDQGLTPTSNTFFNLYFMLTGIHLVHVLVGTGVLTYMLMHIRRTRVEHQNHMFLEAGATFWHMVDLIWIVLFPLLYLLH